MIFKFEEYQAAQLKKSQQQSLQVALQLIWKAWQYAVDMRVDPWQFAVELTEFQLAGISKSELRWLIANRYAIPAIEVTHLDHPQRQFEPLHNVLFPENTCFILSEIGAARLNAQSNGQHNPVHAAIKITKRSVKLPVKAIEGIPAESTPHWDQKLKLLRVGETIVKQFRTRAANQEKILSTFQQSGWPKRIENPLSFQGEHDPKRRLNDTIKCLNRNQTHKLLRFHGDGTATGILWEIYPEQ